MPTSNLISLQFKQILIHFLLYAEQLWIPQNQRYSHHIILVTSTPYGEVRIYNGKKDIFLLNTALKSSVYDIDVTPSSGSPWLPHPRFSQRQSDDSRCHCLLIFVAACGLSFCTGRSIFRFKARPESVDRCYPYQRETLLFLFEFSPAFSR